MFKLLRHNKGQSTTVQYTLTFFLVVGFIAAMSIYIRRVIQGRVFEARNFMGATVNKVYSGNIYLEYEPYYTETEADRRFGSRDAYGEAPGLLTHDFNQTTNTTSTAKQTPPR